MTVVIFSASATTYSHKIVDFTIRDRNPELKYVPQIYGHVENRDSVANKVNSIKHWDLVFVSLKFKCHCLLNRKCLLCVGMSEYSVLIGADSC